MEAAEWQLDGLAEKVGQYCFMLQNLTGEDLARACEGDYDRLRLFLHKQGMAAYEEKV